MNIYKGAVLIMAGVIFICLPIFIWLFVKTFYYCQKMIFNIKKDVYQKGAFILGPFLLMNKKYFNEEGQKSRIIFKNYLVKTLLMFIFMVFVYMIMTLYKYLF